jgi:FYVE/RhoGEF/PH domain-containing protein 5/6
MSLIALQKATHNLPFPLIVPGRTLLRRATMMKVDRGSDRRVRDLLLFSDCLVWISRGGEREDWGVLGEWASVGLETGHSVWRDSVILESLNTKLKPGLGHDAPPPQSHGIRQTGRVRSRSAADALPVVLRPSSSANVLPPPDPFLLRPVTAPRDENEERWWYRGKVELLDVEVVVSPIISSPGEERMLEVLSPEGSFALYAGMTRHLSISPAYSLTCPTL